MTWNNVAQVVVLMIVGSLLVSGVIGVYMDKKKHLLESSKWKL